MSTTGVLAALGCLGAGTALPLFMIFSLPDEGGLPWVTAAMLSPIIAASMIAAGMLLRHSIKKGGDNGGMEEKEACQDRCTEI